VKFRNLLVRATNWVGDAVMSIPALRALREAHPDARITILGRPWVADLYGREPFCDEAIAWRGYSLEAVRELRARGFDAALLLQNAFGAAAVAKLAGIPRRIGYDRDARGWMLTDAIRVPRPGEIPPHESYYYLELLRRARLIETPLPPEPFIRLTGYRWTPESVVGVSPGAAYGGAKRWLPDRFAAAAVRIARETNSSVIVFGTPPERGICAQVTAAIAAEGVTASNKAGETSMSEFLDLVSRCRAMLTNDSGSMHIASALGVPTVVVFGATNHITTGPTGPLARVVREPVHCSPCLKRECPIDHRCMTGVPADRVAAAALDLLK
jgi:heptosyltransferase-2